MAVSPVHLQHAEELETLLAEGDFSPEVRERLSFIAEQLRLGRMLEEIVPPNIRIDEPIPGHHKAADAARAQSPTGDLPRTDIAAPKPPEEMVPTHAFSKVVRRQRPSVADLNPSAGDDAGQVEKSFAAAGVARRMPALPDVEHAVPEGDTRDEL